MKISSSVMGWDVGGAHLKVVLIDPSGSVVSARQIYCPLWHGLQVLEQALDSILSTWHAPQHCVTMTGELADIFPDRHTGVVEIAQTLQKRLNGQVRFYAVQHGEQFFLPWEAVVTHTQAIASMNWLASAYYVAHHIPQVLFLDIGSTTTDITVIHGGRPAVSALSDAERLQQDTLVYTGVIRTSLMALGQKILFSGVWVNVVAEHFATTADVYTLTGDLTETDNSAETADGMDKSMTASAKRIARMIGWDAQDAPLSVWCDLADAFKQAQLLQIKQAVLRQLSLFGMTHNFRLVAAGVGEFLARDLAQQLGVEYQSAHCLMPGQDAVTSHMTTVCFPAYAVAYLGQKA